MSAFEKLPREIRDLIYDDCLLYDGEIVPFPSKNEREGNIELYPVRKDSRNAFLGCPRVKREKPQIEKKPCVALLGVNSAIREEAASILFGKNVWRLSSNSDVIDDRYRFRGSFWETYAKYFRHVVTRFEACDLDEVQLLRICMAGAHLVEEDRVETDQREMNNIHQEQLDLLRDSFTAKAEIMHHMNLKSLLLDFSELSCPMGCCRLEALQSCWVILGTTGPWHKWEQERSGNLENKLEMDIKILGLENDEEEKLFWETWGLVVDWVDMSS